MNNEGFTYIEIILYTALVSIFLLSVTTFAWNIIGIRVKGRVQQDVIDNVRQAAGRIEFEIRNASGFNSVNSNSISLINEDPSRDPTNISVSNGRILIGWGNGGDCPVSNPCFLTAKQVSFTNVTFTDLSNGGSKNIGFQLSAEAASGGNQIWNYQMSAEGSVEIRAVK